MLRELAELLMQALFALFSLNGPDGFFALKYNQSRLYLESGREPGYLLKTVKF
jgi:hypothetical protein